MIGSVREWTSQENPAGGVEKGGDVLLAARPFSYLFPRAVPAVLILGVAVYSLVTDPRDDPLVVVLLAVTALTLMVLPILLFVKACAQPWAVRIGPDGVTWQNDAHVAWTSVAEVRVRVRRRLRIFGLPGVRLIGRREADFADRANSRPLGHLIDTRYLTSSPEEVLSAIAQFATLPIVCE